MIKTLDQVTNGERGTVIKIEGEGKVRRRLFDMGVTPGATFFFRKKAPLGDPIEITIRDYELSLRKAEAVLITVDCQSDEEDKKKG